MPTVNKAWLFCLLLALTTLAWAGAVDEVEQALREVRDVKADLFVRESSVLGKLPGPAEMAAAEADRRALHAPRPPFALPFTQEQKHALARDYTHYTFTGKSRLSACFPVGVTGVHVRDIARRTELLVVAVEDKSPASGLVELDDVIIGANGRLFTDAMDPRPAMGYALVNSQTPALGGKLTLQLARKGAAMNVALDIGAALPFARTWPFDCKRSAQVAEAALRCVIDNSREARNLANIHAGGGFWTLQFLMASGDDTAMDLARRGIYAMAAPEYPDEVKPASSWVTSYALISLAEYYLLTGDSAVLPAVQYKTKMLELQQFRSGSWSHGMPGGYGEINNVGIPSFIGLLLARECGVEVSPVHLARSIRFFGKFCGTNFPYGLGSPGGRSGRMDNGMNSMAAVAFHILGEEAMADRWARSVCYMWLGRERGHAEGIFSFVWGPLGAALAPREEFHMFMNNMLWYYELMRTREGGFVFTRYGSATGGRFPYPVGSTPALALFHYLPQRRLRILGAPRGVFGVRPPKALAAAAQAFKDKQWGTLEAELAKHVNGDYAKGLRSAYEQMEKDVAVALVLAAANIKAKKPAAAVDQLDALKRLLGAETPAMAKVRAALPPAIPKRKWPRQGKRGIVTPKTTLFAVKPPRGVRWADILPSVIGSDKNRKEACTVATTAPKGRWYDPAAKPVGWKRHKGKLPNQEVWVRRAFTFNGDLDSFSVMQLASTANGEAYLNGLKLADLKPGAVDLRPGIVAALKEGDNVLAARLTPGKGVPSLGLKAGSTKKAPDLDDALGDL
ncbi:hypothetical protein HQ560_22715 [bacterium]|nr:hypothetical protein [bacterium]